jgi:hypothetical protein
MEKKWIQDAIKRPGALTKKAKDAGMSISEYCAQKGLTKLTMKQCSLAKTLAKINKNK